jgi:hypothetical protein
MDKEKLNKSNMAICIYMGGVEYIVKAHYPKKNKDSITVSDLHFNTDWNFIIPVWGKVNKALFTTDSGATLYSMSKAIDNVDLEAFHKLISAHCIIWCKNKQIAI